MKEPERRNRETRPVADRFYGGVPYGGAPYARGYYYGPGAYYGGEKIGSRGLSWALRLMRRKWKLVALGIGIGVAGSLLLINMLTEYYGATSQIVMSIRRPRIMGVDGAIVNEQVGVWQADEIFNTRLHKFRGRATRETAIAILKEQGRTNASAVAPASFSLVADSFVVNITCIDPNAEWAAISANAYAAAAVRVMEEENRKLSDRSVAWLEDQAESQKNRLEEARSMLTVFRAEHSLDLLENRNETAKESLRTLGARLTAIEADAVLVQKLYDAIVSAESADDLPSTMDGADELRTLISAISMAKAEREMLLARYRVGHPKALASAQNITALEQQLEAARQTSIRKARSNLELLKAQQDSLTGEIEKRQELAADLESETIELHARQAALERERQAADMSYREVLARMEQARLSADEKTAAVEVQTEATPSSQPILPKKGQIFILGVLLGSLFGVGLAFLRDQLEDYITASDDVEQHLGLQVLGIVPLQDSDNRKELALAVLQGKDYALTEAFAGLRASMEAAPNRETSGSVLITSAGIGCGKTIVACNLATTCALSGSRTLLVDLDLRRPRLGAIFEKNVSEQASLTHALVDADCREERFAQIPQKTECADLEVAVSAPHRDFTPANIIGGQALARFLEWAKARYDQVIIDSPPHGLLSDAAVISAHVGGVIIICRPEKSRKRALAHTARHLKNVGAHVLGAVINAAPPHKGFMGSYGYYYHHSYYKLDYGAHDRQVQESDKE